jgi:hypothetical protein
MNRNYTVTFLQSIVLILLSMKMIFAEPDCGVDSVITNESVSTIANDSTEVIDELIGSEIGDHTEIGRQCLRYENIFRTQVEGEVDSTLEYYTFLEQCFDGLEKPEGHECITRQGEVDDLFNGLRNYREKNLKLHTELANNWIENLPQGHKEVAERCFRSQGQMQALSDGSIQRTQGIEFENNIRRLKPQVDNYSSCQPVSYLWGSDLDARKKAAVENPASVSMTRPEVEMMEQFDNSPANILLSSNTKDNPNLSNQELRKSFHVDIKKMKDNLKGFKDKISRLENKRLYYLYNFENQYENFTSNLPEGEREFALSCKNNSGFIKDCITAREVEGRCGSRSWDIAESIIPFVALIDAMEGYRDVDTAMTSGLYTAEEARRMRSGLTMQFVLGIPLPPGMLAGAKIGSRVALKNIDNVGSQVTTFLIDESSSVLLPRILASSGVRSNRVAIEAALTGLEGTAKMGSCKATCDTFVKKIFTRTRNDQAPLRLDIYNTGSTHYHIRTQAGDIVDPTYQQFFNFGRDHVGDVFYGNKDDLIKEIGRLREEVGFNSRIANYFSSRTDEEVYDFIWGQASLHRSGSELRYFDDIGETLFD